MKLWRMKLMLLMVMMSAGFCDLARAEERGGTAVGLAVAKGAGWIEVRADGASETIRYRARWIGGMPKDGGGLEQTIVEAIRKVAVPNRVRLQWIVEEGPRVTAIETLRPAVDAGIIEGTVTSRGETWIEVKPFGDGPAERYMPRWIGGLPKNGGGLDKAVSGAMREFKIGDKVRLEWLFDERKRVVAIRSAA